MGMMFDCLACVCSGSRFREVAASSVRTNPESFLPERDRVGLLPSGPGLPVTFEICLENHQAGLLVREEFLDQADRCGPHRISGLTFQETD